MIIHASFSMLFPYTTLFRSDPAHALQEVQGDPFGLDDSTGRAERIDRKSTRLNSSHVSISYAVFCLKEKNLSKKRLRSNPINHAIGTGIMEADFVMKKNK